MSRLRIFLMKSPSSSTKVNTATVSTNEASTWPVRYLCSVFTLFFSDAGTILKPGREIRNAKMKGLAAAHLRTVVLLRKAGLPSVARNYGEKPLP